MATDSGTGDLEWCPHIYSPLHPAALFVMQRRQRIIRGVIERMVRRRQSPFSQCSLLEIGCGAGQWVLEFQKFGLRSANYAGMELDPKSAAKANAMYPDADIRAGDASKGLPWYDFTFDNPKNANVKGVGKREVSELFSPWKCRFRTVSLAPPIARRIVPVSWFLAEALETFFPFLRSHVIAEIEVP